MKIYCCSCDKDIEARLTDGSEIYPHRTDLYSLPFWVCDICNQFVGCHHKTKDRTKPLGVIPTTAIKNKRKEIHSLLDPLWKSNKVSRSKIYSHLSKQLGKEYHTATIKSLHEADMVISSLKEMYKQLRV